MTALNDVDMKRKGSVETLTSLHVRRKRLSASKSKICNRLQYCQVILGVFLVITGAFKLGFDDKFIRKTTHLNIDPQQETERGNENVLQALAKFKKGSRSASETAQQQAISTTTTTKPKLQREVKDNAESSAAGVDKITQLELDKEVSNARNDKIDSGLLLSNDYKNRSQDAIIKNGISMNTANLGKESADKKATSKLKNSERNDNVERPKDQAIDATGDSNKKLKSTSFENNVAENFNMWDDPVAAEIIPRWLKDYFSWHAEQRKILNSTNWQSYRYLLVRCVPSDKKCAGAADRLKSIPVALRMAKDANRLLFIAWKQRPADLEEFLLPPESGGFDWRLPDWLGEKVNITAQGPKFFMESKQHRKQWLKLQESIIRVKNLRGSEYYDDLRESGEPSFDEVYREVWKICFRPSPSVAVLIQKTMDELGLEHGKYVGTHVRALYRTDNTADNTEEIKALNCAAQIASNTTIFPLDGGNKTTPIFFTSDSINTTMRALKLGDSLKSLNVVAKSNFDVMPLHLDRGGDFLQKSDDWQNRPASDFYSVFVDLYLLANSRCVVYGFGSYGSWASLMSYDRTCAVNYKKTKCKYVQAK